MPPEDPDIKSYFEGRMKHIRDAKPIEVIATELARSHEMTTAVNLIFSSADLRALLANARRGQQSGTKFSQVDAFMAYIVAAYNRALWGLGRKAEAVTAAVDTIDYRGHSHLAPPAMFGNAAITLTCPQIPPSADYSTGHNFGASVALVAQTIREARLQAKDPSFLTPYLQFHNHLCDNCYQNYLFQYLLPATPHEMTFNSSHAANWHKAADFFERGSSLGDARRTRFHTTFLLEKYVRIFGANAMRVSGSEQIEWDDDRSGGVEAAFRVEKCIAERFMEKINLDIANGFRWPAAAL